MVNINLERHSLEDFIWMSCRYCIGRHTISSAAHADTIAKVLRDNPKSLPQFRYYYLAKEIRSIIRSQCTWNDTISADGYRDFDVLSAVLLKSAELKDPKKYAYNVNTITGEVTATIPEIPITAPFDVDAIDLIPWVKLANWLDKNTHVNIVMEFDGKTIKKECFPFPIKIDGKYQTVYARVEDADISINKWIASEYILKKENVIITEH